MTGLFFLAFIAQTTGPSDATPPPTTPAPVVKKKKPPLVCRADEKSGSRLPTRICKTAEEWGLIDGSDGESGVRGNRPQ